MQISFKEKQKIDAILHEDDSRIFLTDAVDNRFWTNKDIPGIDSDDITISFDGKTLEIPANCLTEQYIVRVSTSKGAVFEDWTVEKVKRPKNATECVEFVAVLVSNTARNYNYTADESITITVIPISYSPDCTIEFNYLIVAKKTLGIFSGVEFERVTG